MHKKGISIRDLLFYLIGIILIIAGGVSIYFSVVQNTTTASVDEVDIVATGFVPVMMEVPTATPDVTPTEAITATPVSANQTALPTPTPPPSPTPTPQGEAPSRIIIPELGVDAPVKLAEMQVVKIDEKNYSQWMAPDEEAAGWQRTSLGLGVPGNTVLNGHHNVFGKVFKNLTYLVPGDTFQVYGETHIFTYYVENKMLLAEREVSLEKRIENTKWILPTTDERLTLITCWPETSNTHRLIIIAKPLSKELMPAATPAP